MNKEIIPTQLDIILTTNIPGIQDIAYKPSMTLPNTSEKIVQFNPLYKLNKIVVEKMPAGESRIKPFFHSYLFKGLLRGSPANTLLEATEYGYVDNNITITLATLFPVNSVIYLNSSPYAIGDVQWTSGDWHIKIEPKRVLTGPNYIKKGGGPTVISYEIKIDLQLFPGTTIPPDKVKELKCNATYNSIWKNYSILTGEKYRPSTNYDYTSNPSRTYSTYTTMNETELKRKHMNEEEDLKRKHKSEENNINRRLQYEADDLRRNRRDDEDSLRRRYNNTSDSEYLFQKDKLDKQYRRKEDELSSKSEEYEELVRRNRNAYEDLKRRNQDQYEDLKRKNEEKRIKQNKIQSRMQPQNHLLQPQKQIMQPQNHLLQPQKQIMQPQNQFQSRRMQPPKRVSFKVGGGRRSKRRKMTRRRK